MPRRRLEAPLMPRLLHSSTRTPRAQRWTVEKVRAVLAEQAASGLSPSAFARQEGIDVQRLHRWRRLLTTDTSMPAFLELRPRSSDRVEVVLTSGRVLRVSEQISETALLRLVEILERGAPC